MVGQVQLIELPKIFDSRGNLTFIESNAHIPFEIKRTYWIYDVPGGEIRGGHAFKMSHELIIALSGSFDVLLNNGKQESRYTLNRSYYGLYVPNMIWKSMENFSTNSLALVVSNISFDQKDYIRNFDDFIQMKDIYEE